MAKIKQIVECVPNFSEGRDMSIIRQITDEVESVKGVKLLDVDPGEATNRTGRCAWRAVAISRHTPRA